MESHSLSGLSDLLKNDIYNPTVRIVNITKQIATMAPKATIITFFLSTI